MRQPSKAAAFPTLQRRSEATRARLLDAAEALLAAAGVEACTVPAIAERAGVAVGSVYRRFPDKDALLRAVHDRFFERTGALNLAAFDPNACRDVATADLVAALVGGLVAGYRANRGILAALIRYAESHPDPTFRRTADQARDRTLVSIRAMIVERVGDIGHQTPGPAVDFLMAVLATVARAAILDQRPVLRTRTDEQLTKELTRLAVGYLGVGPPPKRRCRQARLPVRS